MAVKDIFQYVVTINNTSDESLQAFIRWKKLISMNSGIFFNVLCALPCTYLLMRTDRWFIGDLIT